LDIPISDEGPWLVFTSSRGIWAVNANGDGAEQLYEYPEITGYGFSLDSAPGQGLFAFTGPLGEETGDFSQVGLFVFRLPSATPMMVLPLISPAQYEAIATLYPLKPETGWSEAWYQREQVLAAVSNRDSLAWSPNGRYLAFIAALDGPTSDLYVLDMSDTTSSRLTDGPTQAMDPEWSPDSEEIIHRAVSDINIGRSGTDVTAGVWTASADGSGARLLVYGNASMLGWLSHDVVLINHWAMGCDSYDIEVVSLHTGNSSLLWRGSYVSAAANAQAGILLVGVSFEAPYTEGDPFWQVCPVLYPPGLYRVSTLGGTPELVGEFHWGRLYPTIRWLPSRQEFLVVQGAGFGLYSAQGYATGPQVRSPAVPVFSPSGDRYIMASEGELYIYDEEHQVIDFVSGLFCNPGWRPDGEAIYFSDDENLYIAEAPDYEPVLAVSGLSSLCWSQMRWVVP
jgi:hypothetical protein